MSLALKVPVYKAHHFMIKLLLVLFFDPNLLTLISFLLNLLHNDWSSGSIFAASVVKVNDKCFPIFPSQAPREDSVGGSSKNVALGGV